MRIIAVIIAITLLCGWVANIVKLFGESQLAWIAGRIVGIFVAPIGAILGFF